MRTTPIPTPVPGPSPRIRSWRVSRASHKAPRPPKPHNLCHEPLLQDTSPPQQKCQARGASPQQESPLRGIPYRDIMRSDWAWGGVMGLDISIREAGHVRILDLQGRLIIGAEADQLQTELRRLIENGCRQIVVNLSCVEQIDSTGISTLVRNCTGLVRAGGSLKLVCPAGRVRNALEVTRLVSAIPTFDDEPQALASLRPAGPPRQAI